MQGYLVNYVKSTVQNFKMIGPVDFEYGVHGLQKEQVSEKRFKVLHTEKFKIKLDNSFILTQSSMPGP